MTDQAYWDEWNVAERMFEDNKDHKDRTETPVEKPAPAPAPLSREAAIAYWDNSALVAAAATGDAEWLQELLVEGEDVNELSPGSFDYSPLIVAAQKGHAEIVHILLMTGMCDLTKKHMDYISALDSALHGYYDLSGVDAEFTPQIRAMIIRAHVETADRISLNTLLHIEASGAVLPEYIRAFRSGSGVRMTKAYPKKLAGKLDLSDPPVAKMPAIISAARHAARCIASEKEAADAAAAIAANKSLKMKKISGPSAAPSRLSTSCVAAERAACSDDEDDAGTDKRSLRRKADAYNPSLDDTYGKMSRRFNF
jgi:hypothetical protein